jgi:mono/diheme cytochrome c family protein
MNYLGTGANVRTEAYFAIYSFGAGSPNDRTAKVPFPPDDRLDAFLAFFGAFAPPAAPAQDAALVANGRAVFEAAKCGSCHHPEDIGLDQVVTYDKGPTGVERYPGDDPAFPNGSIRTDILHRVLIDDSVGPDAGTAPGDAGVDNGYGDLIAFMIEHRLSVMPTDGYRTSDLRGLWATAPYLHNGSVPTLEDLLKKASDRPPTWMRGSFAFDTTQIGNSNAGHEFGANLSDADKASLVAYLRSL